MGQCKLIFGSPVIDWAHAPAYIDPDTDAGNEHYNSGGRRIVRINNTTIAIVNHGGTDRLYRSTDNGANWTQIDGESGASSCLVSGPSNMVYHFTRYAGNIRMVRFAYNAESIPAPTNIATDNGGNGGAYNMLNATVNQDGDLFVFWHEDIGGTDDYDGIRMTVSTDGGDNWSAKSTVRAGSEAASWIGIHSDVTPNGDIVLVYHNWGTTRVDFSISDDDGASWDHTQIADSGTVHASNPCILPVGTTDLYVFAQSSTLDGLVFLKSTDGGASWGTYSSWTSIQANALMGYGDPSPALGSDGTIYVAFRGNEEEVSLSDDLRSFVAMSTDGGSSWTFPDNHMSGGRVGTRSTMRYQTWHNYGGPLEWTWLEEDGEDTSLYPTMYDIATGITLYNRT